jgi:transposase
VIRSLQDLREEWESLDERLRAYDDELAALTRENQQARQLATIPGIGVINATALLAAIGDGSAFAKGRDLAAWLGLTPRQHSTGGRTKLLGISKRGNKYLRTQLLAAKLARIVWAVLRHGRAFEHQGHAMA